MGLKAMILCGGKGTRLREFTELIPKPMVEIGGRPILWHIMKLYAHYGIREFILCAGYKADIIKRYFLEYEALNADFTVELGQGGSVQLHQAIRDEAGLKVTVAYTGDESMTGARVKLAARYLEDDDLFFLTYGDGVADVDLQAQLAFHRSHEGLVTITGVRPPTRFGMIQLSGNRVVSFDEKPQIQLDSGLINGGYLVMDRGFLDYLTEDDSCVLEGGPLSQCALDGQMFLYEHTGFWHCMDTHRDWMTLEYLWNNDQAPWKVWA